MDHLLSSDKPILGLRLFRVKKKVTCPLDESFASSFHNWKAKRRSRINRLRRLPLLHYMSEKTAFNFRAVFID
jgi:hypothetical protein